MVIVCPAVATVARMTHLNWEGQENRIWSTLVCNLLTSDGETFQTVPFRTFSYRADTWFISTTLAHVFTFG